MSHYHYIEEMFKLEEGCIKYSEFLGNKQIFYVAFSRQTYACPHCHSHTDQIKDYRQQLILLAWFNDVPVYASLRKRRYLCPVCGHSFYPSTPLVHPYQRRSQHQQLAIIQECARKQSFTDIANRFHLSVPTVIRYFDHISYGKPATLPAILSLDEFKGNAQGQKYQVAVVDPAQKKVLDILPQRDTQKLIQYFAAYPYTMRKKVNYVVMDASALFRSVVHQIFPHAAIICDKYHVVRQVIWAMENVRKRVQKQFDHHRIYFKRNKRILTKPGCTLTTDELICLEEILSQSDELRKAYALKECFYRVLKMPSRKLAVYFLSTWLELVKAAQLTEFQALLRAFKDWFDGIINAIRLHYSNGFIEGHNNKIKVLKRVCFGIRNFNRFRNRILFMDAWSPKKKRNTLDKCSSSS